MTNGSGDLPGSGSSFGRALWAVLRKECVSEWRTRLGANAALLFAITALTSVSFAVGRLGTRTDVLAALLLAALASLSHTFVREADAHTMTLLRLSAPPAAIAAGKLLFNLFFLGLIELVTVPVFLVLMGGPGPAWRPFLATLALGSVAL